jgi:hypothetical protein
VTPINAPTVRSSSPWGTIDHVETIAEGVVSVNTPSHGGIWLSAERLKAIKPEWAAYAAKWSGSPQWYEEDVAVCAVMATWPELFPNHSAESVRFMIEHYSMGSAA